MTIKTFDFPPFEEWNKTRKYAQKIGDYTCTISIVIYGLDKDYYDAAVANSDNPINIYADDIFFERIRCNTSDEKTLKEWYEEVIVKLNNEWKKFILETYCYSECNSKIINLDEGSSNRVMTIIMMIKHITGLPINEILKNVKDTNVYKWIIEKSMPTLYDSVSGNLEEMVDEWKEKNIPIFSKITVQQISNSYRWVEGIED